MKASRFLALALLGVALLGVGCGKKAPSAPDQALLAAVDAIKANKPGDLWVLLPPSYQKDVQDLVTTATSKLDKETFELAVKVLDKAVVVLDKQGDKLGFPIPPQLKKMIADGYSLLKDVKLLDYGAVSKLDVGSFLDSSGARLMAFGMSTYKTNAPKQYDALMSELNGVTVKVVKVEGDKAELEVTIGKKTENVKMVKVEGRWIPAEMADGWKNGVAQAKIAVEMSMGEMAKHKDQTKAMLAQILDGLTKVEGGDMSGLEPLKGLLGSLM